MKWLTKLYTEHADAEHSHYTLALAQTIVVVRVSCFSNSTRKYPTVTIQPADRLRQTLSGSIVKEINYVPKLEKVTRLDCTLPSAISHRGSAAVFLGC